MEFYKRGGSPERAFGFKLILRIIWVGAGEIK